MNASVDPRSREAYWQATQSELKSIRRRGDLLILGGALVLLALVALNREYSRELVAWLVVAGALVLVFLASLWFVTKRKRRVAMTRGLVCGSCDYMPHDTEIDDVASSRRCPRCNHALES